MVVVLFVFLLIKVCLIGFLFEILFVKVFVLVEFMII